MYQVTAFDDLLAANEEFSATFTDAELTGRAAQGLAIVTCMDSRIDPLGVFGLKPGDAKILRNAGARVTDDVLRTLVLAVTLLNVSRVLVMPHTDCGMAKVTDDDVHRLAAERGGHPQPGVPHRPRPGRRPPARPGPDQDQPVPPAGHARGRGHLRRAHRENPPRRAVTAPAVR
nr:hypothetical protein GCM10020093_044950 [Planobispora longispora]